MSFKTNQIYYMLPCTEQPSTNISYVGKAAVRIREYIITPEAREQIRIPVMDLVKKLGYSHRTVCDALRLLVKEKLVEKYGRYYAITQEQQ